MNISIIGNRASGKTTFLVLLYAAQIKYSEVSDGEFRFFIDPRSIKAISNEYNRMQMGKWPTDKLVKKNRMVSFLIGLNESGSKSKFLNIFNKEKTIQTTSLDFSMFDLIDTEISKVIDSNTMSFINTTQKVESLLNSRLVVILLDSSKVPSSRSREHRLKNGPDTTDISISNVL